MQKDIYVTVEEIHEKDCCTHEPFNVCHIAYFDFDKPKNKVRIVFDTNEITRYVFKINVTYDGRKKTITEKNVLKSMAKLGYIDYKANGNMFSTFNLIDNVKNNSLDTQKIYNHIQAQNFTTQLKKLLNKYNISLDKVGDMLGTTDIPELMDKGLNDIEKTLINY